jgi:hypothetical protein
MFFNSRGRPRLTCFAVHLRLCKRRIMNRSNKVSTRRIKTKPALALVAAIALLLTGISANGQVGYQMRDIKNADGLLIISDVEGNYFRMQIIGSNVYRLRTTKKYWYMADGIRFQFFSEENAHFVMTDVPKLDDSIVLKLYRSEFLRRNADDKPKLRSSWLKLANNKTALLFTRETRSPTPQRIPEKQMFLVVAGPMHIFGLFASVPPGQTEAQVKRVLIRTLGSLKIGDNSET